MKKIFILLLSVMISVFSPVVTVFADDPKETKTVKPVIEHHFDNNDYLSWQKNGSCSIRTAGDPTDINEENRNYCLKIDMRHTFWSGPQLIIDSSSDIVPGQSYIFSIRIYQDSGKSNDFDLILRSTLSDNSDSYITINKKMKSVPSGFWTELNGTVTIPANWKKSNLYIETSDSLIDYYIDDLTVTKNTVYHDLFPSNINDSDSDENETTVFISSFENNIPEVWYSKDSCRLLLQNQDPELRHTGHSSMKVTNRSSSSDGPVIDISEIVETNKRYTISCWLYLPNTYSEKMAMTLEWQNTSGEISKKSFATLNILPNSWTKISGSVLIPSDALTPTVCINSLNTSLKSNSRFTFYVDFFSITTNSLTESVSDAVPEKKSKIITYDFESDDNSVSGKDKAVLFRTKDKKHSGKYSVFVSERKTDQSGILFNIDNISREKTYNFSAWVSYDIIDDTIKNDHTFYLSVHYYINDDIINKNLDSNRIQNNESWINLSGQFNVPKDARDVTLIINTKKTDNPNVQRVSSEKNDLVSFYADDVKITGTDYISIKQIIFRVAVIIVLVSLIIVLFMILKGCFHSRKY